MQAFGERVDVVRVGTLAATNADMARRWQRERERMSRPQQGLTGASLEQAIASLAAAHPDLVEVRS